MTLDAGAETTLFVSPADEAPSSQIVPTAAAVTLEFTLGPDDMPALARLPGLRRGGPAVPVRLLWHDDAEHAIASRNLSLLRDGATWQLDRLAPDDRHDWPACAPPPPIARADELASLAAREPDAAGDWGLGSIPFDVVPVSAFEGRRRTYHAGSIAIEMLHGEVRGVVETRPACRLRLTGTRAELAALLPSLTSLALSVPRASLAREAIAAANGTLLPARHVGAPALDGEVAVGDGLATVITHLLDALLFWTDGFRRDRQPEAIHQARVATRRLRSALALYRPAACPELAAIAAAVKRCAATLGDARDWDVFLTGAGSALADARPGDARVATLLRAAARQRETAYTSLGAYLDSPAFRHLTLDLATAAALTPWQHAPDPDPDLHAPTGPFAAGVLDQHIKRVRRRARGLDALPIEALHELRKDCKRLRYAAEFFAPAFPAKYAKPFLRRLAALQEVLGALNDTATAGLLLAQLGRAGRGYAGGMVDGMAAAAALPARASIAANWKRFKRVDPFWR